MEALVSVVIPTYNRSDVVGRAIESVLAQTYTNFELLVIDDGSDDDTKKTIERIIDGRIRYHKHTQNLGESQARNTGVSRAIGKFIAFLDSDDEWLPVKLSEQLTYMENATNDEIGCATAFYRVYLDQRKVIVPQKKMPCRRAFYFTIFFILGPQCWSSVKFLIRLGVSILSCCAAKTQIGCIDVHSNMKLGS